MANTVEIIVKAVDQTKGAFSGLSGGLIGLNQGLELARKGFQALGDIYRATIQQTVDYTSSVIDMGRVLGISVEDTSRLIQASDDLFISQEKLNTALLAASRQGIDVSINGLQNLSREYLSLAPGAERAQFLMHTFGRSGADMGKLMEVGASGIENMTSAIKANLVVTEAGAASVIEYKQTIDALQDSWTGVKLELGNAVIPVLNKSIKTLTENTEWNRFVRQEVDRLGISYRNFGYYTESGIETNKEWWESHYKAAKMVEVATGRYDKMSGSIDKVNESAKKASSSIGTITQNLGILSNVDMNVGSNIAEALKKIDFREAGGYPLQKAGEALLGMIDTGAIGTELGAELATSIGVGLEAVKVKAGEETAFEAKQVIIDTLGLTWAEADKQLSAWLANMSGKTATINVQIKYSQPGMTSYDFANMTHAEMELYLNRDLDNPPNGIGRAGGGPVWGSTPYVVGERGPEVFVPNQNGQIVPNKQLGGNQVTFYGDAYFAVDRELTAQDIMKQMRVEA